MHKIESIINDLLQLRTHSNISSILDTISDFVKVKGNSVTTHQVRRIYNEVKKTKGRGRVALHLLRPNIVYTIARGKEDYFLGFLEKVLSKVETDEQVGDYITFFESVVAYHKFHHNK